MSRKAIVLSMLTSTILFYNCDLIPSPRCPQSINVDFSNNTYSASLTFKPNTLRVNDKFTITIPLPNKMVDTKNEEYPIVGPPTVIIGFTDLDSILQVDTTNFFSLGARTFYNNFDEYFGQSVLLGYNTDIFRYETIFYQGAYRLNIDFWAKNPGTYVIGIEYYYDSITISKCTDSGGTCYFFEPPEIAWQASEFNLRDKYPTLGPWEDNSFILEVQ